MRLYYYKDPIGNFGDDLNPWLWPRLISNIFDVNNEIIFLGIGTLLNQKVDRRVPASAFKVVFGSGVGYGKGKLPLIDNRWKFYCVRGPLSAYALSLDQKLAITDPAVLIKTIDLPKELKIFNLSFMPHHKSARGVNWKSCCEAANINYIDPSADIREVLSNINRSEVVVTEAMHGAIVADALRIPWIPIRFFDHILEFKWQDWCHSLKLEYKPITLNRYIDLNISDKWDLIIRYISEELNIKKLINNIDPVLSSDSTIELVTSQLQEKLARLKAEYFT